jgi:hypothetical protein
MVFSWPAAISNADAEMKPEITGWLRKLARKPSLNTPISSSTSPESSASVIAALQYAALPMAARSPIAVAVISETTATGPTASTRLLPSTP